jgi:hypothetical protein
VQQLLLLLLLCCVVADAPLKWDLYSYCTKSKILHCKVCLIDVACAQIESSLQEAATALASLSYRSLFLSNAADLHARASLLPIELMLHLEYTYQEQLLCSQGANAAEAVCF